MNNSSALKAAIAAATLTLAFGAQAAPDMQHKISGYVQMDTIFDDENDGKVQGNDLYNQALIKLGANEADGEGDDINMSSLHSRINVTSLASGGEIGTIKSVIEGDFFSGSAKQFNLRHAYFTTNNVTFGQTWSTFMDLSALPEKGDFGGAAARVFSRKNMVKYSTDLAGGKLDLAVEQPIASIDGESDAQTPDIIAKFTQKTDFGHLSAGTVIQNISYDDGTNDDSTLAVAARASGRINIGKDNLKFAVIAGKGLGGYLNFGDVATGTLDADNKIALSETVATRVSFQHFWSPTLRSTLVYGKTTSDLNDVDQGDFTSSHLNVVYAPYAKLKFGAEIINASKASIVGGEDSKLNRFLAFAKYSF